MMVIKETLDKRTITQSNIIVQYQQIHRYINSAKTRLRAKQCLREQCYDTSFLTGSLQFLFCFFFLPKMVFEVLE